MAAGLWVWMQRLRCPFASLWAPEEAAGRERLVCPVGAVALLAVLAAGCDMQGINHKQMLESLGKHNQQAQLCGGRLSFTAKPLSSPSIHLAVCTRGYRSLGQLQMLHPSL